MGMQSIPSGISPSHKAGNIDRFEASSSQNPVMEKIKTFFQRVIGGRFGAKAGHHSIGGSIRIGLEKRGAGSKTIAGKAAVPPHSYTFKDLPHGKAQELAPWAGASKFADADTDYPSLLRLSANNIGKAFQTKNREEVLLSKITGEREAALDPDMRGLLKGLKAICSDEAHITRSGAIEDPKTGLRATITKDPDRPDRYIVGFGCTGAAEPAYDKAGEERRNKTMRNQSRANFTQYLGLEPKVYAQARQLAGIAADLWGKDKVSTTGHSLGGGLAQYAGLYNGVPAKCFNASPLGVGLQQILGDKIETAGSLVEHFSMRGDWLSHSAAPLPIGLVKHDYSSKTGEDTRPRILSRLADLLGIRTRGNFGVKYYVNFDEAAHRTRIETAAKGKIPFDKANTEEKDTLGEDIFYDVMAGEATDKTLRQEIKSSKHTVERHISILDELSVIAKHERTGHV